MSLKPTTVRIQETSTNLGKLTLEPSPEWDSLTVAGIEDRRRSSAQLSVVSEDSRRHSLFADEDMDQSDTLSLAEEEEDKWRKKQEEALSDRARPSMVVSKDVKEALERQRAAEVFRRTPEMKNALNLFQQAKFLMQHGRDREAMVFIDKALLVDEGNKEWLTEKSRCCLNMLQPGKALEYINKVLKQDNKYFKVLVLKGEVLYSLWDLEGSLSCFEEGVRLRPDNTECLQGVHKVKMAIDEIEANKPPVKRKRKKRKKKVLKKSGITDGRAIASAPKSFSARSSLLNASQTIQQPEVENSARSKSSGARNTTKTTNSAKRRESGFGLLSDDPESLVRGSNLSRPKTSTIRLGSKLRNPVADDSSKSDETSLSSSHRSTSLQSLGLISGSSRHCSLSRYSFSSSMEDMVENIKKGKSCQLSKAQKGRSKLRDGRKAALKSQFTPQTKVSASMARDKMFLECLLRDRDLKRSQTSYTKRVLRMARDLQSFVSEREKYWKNREAFVRCTKPSSEEETLA